MGYDVSDGTLWCGDFGQVHHLTTAGVVLGGFTISASNFTMGWKQRTWLQPEFQNQAAFCWSELD